MAIAKKKGETVEVCKHGCDFKTIQKAVDKTGKPIDNPLRNLWVTETALTTALHSSYFAESVATFAIVMGFALMLTGGGFLVLTLRVLRVFGEEEKTEPAVAQGGAVLSS